MEACGQYPWFERLLEELGIELWVGDAAKVRASVVRKQKTDRKDAEHLLKLLMQDRFPRIWVPSLEVRDVRQLLVHRHKQVQARTRWTKNQLQAMALSQGVQKKYKLWTKAGRTELAQPPLAAVQRKAAAGEVAGSAGRVGSGDQRTQSCSDASGKKKMGQRPEAVLLMDASGSGTGDGVGDGADAGTGAEIRIGRKQVGSYILV